MFSKSKKNEGDTTMAISDTGSGGRRSGKQGVPSIISADMKITGAIDTASDVQMDGSLDGDLRAATATVGENAVVKGQIIAEEVIIRGRVEGGVCARKVTLAATAKVEGDIRHATLSVEAGAYFEGQCKREEDPLASARQDKPKALPNLGAGSGDAKKVA